jgi:hypothetical protein
MRAANRSLRFSGDRMAREKYGTAIYIDDGWVMH